MSSVELLLSQLFIERHSQVEIAAIALTTVQTIIILATVIVAWISVRKFRDSQGVNFIIEAETKIDPLFYQLAGANPSLIRNVYSPYDLSGLTDTECQAFPIMHQLYEHVSRLCSILMTPTLDFGLTEFQRAELLRSWTSYLALFKEHPAMRVMHHYAMTNRDFNEEFLNLASQLMGPDASAKEASP